MRTVPTRVKAWIVFSALLAAGCATSRDAALEDAQFLLDRADYVGAAAKVQPLVTADPRDQEATFILASAFLGKAVLREGSSYLGLLSKVLEDGGNLSPFQTLTKIAPASTEQLPTLGTARDLLVGLTGFVDDAKSKDAYLQLYMARLFEISGVTTRIGANTTTLDCASPTTTYQPEALTGNSEAMARLKDDLANINSDGDKAGFQDDFPLKSRFDDMNASLKTATDAAPGDDAAAFTAFFNEQFCN
jgi:hypothetical protein